MDLPRQPWAAPAAQVLRELDIDREPGPSPSEVEARRERFGPNRLQEAKRRSAWAILLAQFQSLIVALLAAAALAALAFAEYVEGIAILAVIAINATIGFVTELRAVRSMEALQALGGTSARVRRGGEVVVVKAEALVPGDIVLLEGGDTVSADLRLLEANALQADESALTGESTPVDKRAESVGEDAPLAERAAMVFKGTAITRGSGEGVVVATGMDTELGAITSLVQEAESEATPLEERLDRLGRMLVALTLAIAAFVALAGMLAGKEPWLILQTAIALAVATVPEGLPIVATVALARGMWRMARRRALIERLSAVETLGATDVILTDKTGTLTENQMTAVRLELASGSVDIEGEGLETEGSLRREGEVLAPAEDPVLREALEIGVLCNNASLGDTPVGEPMELALLVAGAKAGMRREALLERLPEVREVAFDPEVRMMATVHRGEQRLRVAVKGAPEAVLAASASQRTSEGVQPLSEAERTRWQEVNADLAGDGLRVLALAQRQLDEEGADDGAEIYEELVFTGLVGLLDPPREDVAPALRACAEAGIRVVMVTGDQAPTARKVALAVGLVDEAQAEAVQGTDLPEETLLKTRIFARVDPREKLELIELYQHRGHIVAMTGDGVNDAPALKKADIGVAMGQRGTQVAREAAHMVLEDDAFSTIVAAIEQGRVIFGNIRTFVVYLISCNVSEILVVGLASMTQAPLPLLPLQILFLNLVTDVFPALALGAGEGSEHAMSQPPRDPQEPILARRHWAAIAAYGSLLTAAVLGAFALAFAWLDASDELAVTIAFLTLASAQLWHVFDMRDPADGVFLNPITRNPFVWGALGLCALLLLAAVYVPVLAEVLQVVPPGPRGWALVLGMSALPVLVVQLCTLPPFAGMWKRVGAALDQR